MMPTDAVLAVTFRCNARCAMCGIWKSPPGKELPAEIFERLPASLRDVNLTGGEPFLRDDLPEVHAAVRRACPRARTVISTNGLLTDRIVEMSRQMARLEPGIGVAISLDGPADVHDRQRGVAGAYDCAIRTLAILRQRGDVRLRIAFTATRANAGHFREMYDLARANGVEFTCAVEHASEHYFKTKAGPPRLADAQLRGQIESVVRDELGSLNPKRWARAYFMRGMWQFAAGGGRLLPCRAGRDFFFMDASGDIFTCNAMPYRMGNIAERDFDDIWASPDAVQARHWADKCPNGCWMVCTARTAIRRAWPQAVAWALWHKVAGVHLPAERND